MNINDLSAAVSLRDKLSNLQGQHFYVSEGKALGVTIQSAYQDDALVDAVRPAVLAELNRRIEEAKAAIRELGIECP